MQRQLPSGTAVASAAVDDAKAPVRLSILGATGSIGQSTLDVVATSPKGTFAVTALTANDNVAGLAAAARAHGAEIAAIANPDRYLDLVEALSGSGVIAAAGVNGIDEAAGRETDCVMAAIVGAAGLRPALAAARHTKRLAIANKECLVISGELFLAELAATGTEIIPVDSEHAAVFQVLEKRDPATISQVVLTASGGPFRDWSHDRLKTVTREDALKHPNWSMGSKITIDSATMMNKGLELIEAYHLFALPEDRLDALIHPQSIVHCLVEFCDGSLVAQMAEPDMCTPIAQSLFWPCRSSAHAKAFDLKKLSSLTFSDVDTAKFPAFALARAAMRRGGAAPAVLNGANEAAVEAFLERRIHFLDIATTVAETLDKADQLGLFAPCANIEAALQVDCEARKLARDVMATL